MRFKPSGPSAKTREDSLPLTRTCISYPPRNRLFGGDVPRGGQPAAIGHAGKQPLTFVVAAVILLFIQLTTLFICLFPSPAFADVEIHFENGGVATLTDDGKITGTAHIDNYIDEYGLTYPVTMPDGTKIYGTCLDFKHYAPAPGNYGFTGVPQADGSYKITVHSDAASPNPVQVPALFEWQDPPQRIGDFYWSPTLMGRLVIDKSSAIAGITSNNGSYSLAGAIYGVWCDEACTIGMGAQYNLITNEKGETNEVELPPGKYWVKEGDAPKGFALDTTPYAITIDSGQQTKLSTKDNPLYEAPEVWANKRAAGYDSEQDDVSFEGAEFTVRYYAGVYDQQSLPKQATRTWVLRSDKSGKIVPDQKNLVSGDDFYKNEKGTVVLPLGTVTIQETKPPKGYMLEGQTPDSPNDYQAPIHLSVVNGNDSFRAPVVNDEAQKAGISLQKTDTQTGKTPQGSASFANIRFSIVNHNDHPVTVEGVTYAPNEEIGEPLVTNEKGFASTPNDYLPLGTYEVRETATNDSMLMNAKSQLVTLTEANSGQIVALASDMPNNVVRGGVSVGKVSRETGEHVSQGEAKLSGALFTVELKEGNPVLVNGAIHKPGDVVYTLVTNADGVASTDGHALPYGIYIVREQEPPVGFLPNEGWSREVSIIEDGVVVDLSGSEDSADDQVIRGGFSFNKVDESTMERMPLVAWMVTSNTTGEHHVIVADENGIVDTEVNQHSAHTNGNDGAVADGAVNEEALDENAGIWFSGSADKETTPKDDMGALPYDIYTVEELPSAANDGRDLVSFTVRIHKHDVHIDMGTVDNRPTEIPQIGTTLTFGEQDHTAPVSQRITLVDTVAYDGLIPQKEYTITGELVDKETGDAILDAEGAPVTSSTTFVPHTKEGTIQLSFELDSSALAGRSVVAFEHLLREGKEIATHAELDDEHQTMRFPTIGTTLTDEDGNHEVSYDESVTLVDKVRYNNLVPNVRYEIVGILMVKETGEPLLDATGSEVRATASFVPSEADGSVDVQFCFDGSLAQGKTLVAFETLSRLGVDLVTHADIDDVEQTVHMPVLHTELSDERGHHMIANDGPTELIDTVHYAGLEVGTEYVVEGTLVYKDTGEPVLLESGEEVHASTVIVPDSSIGSTTVTFVVDLPLIVGKEVVAFESLYRDEREVAIHADVNDESQTAYVPEIGTTLLSEKGTHIAPTGDVKLTDTISYKGLRPGVPYTLIGSLMDKATQKQVEGKDGKPVESVVTFTPETSAGTVEAPFELDTSSLKGHSLVAFEYLHEGESGNGREVASHTDINSADQTIDIPSIKTTATNAANGGKTFEESNHVRIKDVVEYVGLTPGKEYTMEGTLYDKDSGKPLTEKGGAAITAKTMFTPTKASGHVEVTFEFDASLVTGSGVVVFETCTHKGVEVAAHADIKDESQTVTITRKEKPSEKTEKLTTSTTSGSRSSVPGTGDPTQALLPAAMALFGLTVLVARKLLE